MRTRRLSDGSLSWFAPAALDRQVPTGPDADEVSVQVHGEVHNLAALCNQLALAAGTPLACMLAAGWRRWSTDLFWRMDGVFAIAVHDAHGLVLYRDPSGLCGLYWHEGADGQVSYATRIDTLLGLPGVGRRIDRRSLHEYLRFLDIAAPHTLHEGLHTVEAGQWVRFGAGSADRGCGSAPAQPVDADLSYDGALATLETHLRQAVDARLVGAASPASFLSGGVDSSLLCAIAARSRKDTTALTVSFDGDAFDEAPIAQRVASHLGLSHQVLRFGRAQYLGALERLGRGMDQPSADPATPATLLAMEHCRNRFDMVLDGTGADEAVGAMPPRHIRLAVGFADALPSGVRRALTRLSSGLPALSGITPMLDFEHPADTMIRWRGFTRAEIEALCGEPVSFADTHFYRTFARFPRCAHFERFSALLGAMPSDRLTQSALISGMLVRYPFCDRNTIGFLRQLRTEWRDQPGEPKRILRSLLARYVPRPIWDLPKHGFNFPLQAFLAGESHALVRRYLDAGRWRQSGLLRADRVAGYARRFMAGDHQLMFRVWALIVLGAWLEQHDHLD